MKVARQIFLAIQVFLLSSIAFSASGRTTEDFDGEWLFTNSDFNTAMMPAFNDRWEPVTLPHDWSSDGPFSADYASGTGYAPGGVAWYRKHFQLDKKLAGKTVTVEFDGIYDNSEIWINGQFVGGRPYGFSSFQCDLTPFVRFGGENIIAVRVDHSRIADSRYYTGSGIYRNVRLVITDPIHIAANGVFVLTPKVSESETLVTVETTWTNEMNIDRKGVVQTTLLSPDGHIVAKPQSSKRTFQGGRSAWCSQQFLFPHPQLWNLDSPKLYRAISKIISSDGKVLDEVTNTFGIREFHFDANTGFWLNGTNLKIKGVCLHHDAGPIGAAVPDKVLERRLRTLKEIGANAIRTSHNPPDPALLDMCDRLGFLVMDEAFDEFTPMKNKWVVGRNLGTAAHFGYGEIFDQWAVTDISDLVRRDRNHPSIIMWSIGNEIDYANDPFSHPVLGEKYLPQNPPAENLPKLAKPLIAAVKSLDRTRPVTAALANIPMSDAVGLADLLDVTGYNYQEERYAADHKKFPKRIIYGSENFHQYTAWQAVLTNNFIAGQFLWTGADYLGEAGPWPNRASAAGLLDLCGFKKPSAWFRQSLWSDRPMVYLCVSPRRYDANSGAVAIAGGRRGFGGEEGWNYPANSSVTVLCFSSCPRVDLLLNGEIIGSKKMSEAEIGRLRWEVPYEAGTLRAVGRDENGRELCHYDLQTAAVPARIELYPDAKVLHGNKDVCNLEFRVVDINGVRVTDAAPEVTFTLIGPGKILGIGNGDVNSVEDCKGNKHHAYQGRGLAILQSTWTGAADAVAGQGSNPGEIIVQAAAPGLESASVTLESR